MVVGIANVNLYILGHIIK